MALARVQLQTTAAKTIKALILIENRETDQ